MILKKEDGERIYMKILVLDDEKEIASLAELYLKNEGYDVVKFYDSVQALEYLKKEDVDLALLDVMLPVMDGFELLKKLREAGKTYPIIMLTAKIDTSDKITGLSLGADDYITKPFNPLEMVSRVKAQLRRYKSYNAASEGEKNADIFDLGGLFVNKQTRQCTLYGNDVPLTPKEFNILWLLCENNGNVLTTEEIFEKVWCEEYLESNNTVMVHIRRIREKLNDTAKSPKFIKTVWGVGYKMEL